MRSVRRILLFGCICIASSILVAGCGGSTRPELGEVHGKITLGGRPLQNASVIFAPENGGRKSMGRTNDQGEYDLTYIRSEKGAKVGPHTVRISTINRAGGRPEIVPARYNTQSELKREVEAGTNELNFELEPR